MTVAGARALAGAALMTCVLAHAADGADGASHDTRRSGYAEMSPATRAMQDDDSANPGMLYVLEGEALWNRPTGSANRSCAACHGEAAASMKGVAARYPAYDASRDGLLDLGGRIEACRVGHQQAAPLEHEDRERLALTAYVARQSRGLPINVQVDTRSRPLLEAGHAAFNRRIGQLNLSCAQCHEARAGLKLGGGVIPQGHPTGYPLYRLEWQALGSLGRRIRNCMIGLRAEPYAFGSPDMRALEYYLMWRARGMTVEAPAVRP